MVPLKFYTDTGSLSTDEYTVELTSPTSSDIQGLYSGPQVWWEVTYYVKNTYGSRYYFTLWDKWGGNLMALDAQPTEFNSGTKTLKLDTSSFEITYDGYETYIGTGIPLFDSDDDLSLPSGLITLHTGDQQEKTNPGGKSSSNGKGGPGKGTTNDGNSYDVDVVWEIGWLDPGQEVTLTIYVAPGLNPAGKLEFTSEKCTAINTGPVLRAWLPPEDEPIRLKKQNFEFAETFRNTLEICVYDDTPE